MTTLSPETKANIQALIRDARAAYRDLQRELDEANAMIAIIHQTKITPAVDAYNNALQAAKDYVEDEVVGQLENYADERREGWEDTDSGQQFHAWLEALRDFDPTTLDADNIEIPEFDTDPGSEGIDEAENLPLRKSDV